MKLSALLAVSAFLAEGILALNCKDGLNYCGRSIMLKNPDNDEEYSDNDLVHCVNGNGPNYLYREEVCYGGCIEAPDGKSDYCTPFAGFIVTTATENCIKLADASHRSSVETAEKKPKSVAKILLLEADIRYFHTMAVCTLLSGGANKGKSGEALWKQTVDFYAKTTDRLQNDLNELKKEQKN
ncbi:hypothetical protein N7532_009713 [Penicillium argentinense]|uniref:Uncharacterized protein n=1 Tax=Penicillium argentinense TaxID=1131581 RepID=A0A9W9F012_9EURO|nr:uncharacterized protein N7532_009734 [Penicillium argentinense]XP_056473010.1 uncharacterized protein N7532_009713 [Penicillium argentinense]KAJ5084963.1 hypothetical protein N7532_009734 [Penicillium argentinense]KAJ5091029.1 hypothetical protein N7532_009713 [Penicillium argentinense]